MKAVGSLKTALVAALRADTATGGVADLVGGRIYDVRPRDDQAAGSWVYVGPVNVTRDETVCALGWRARARVYAASTKLGRDDAWAIAAAIADRLHGATLTMATGGHTPELVVNQAGDVVDPLMPTITFVDVETWVFD